MEVIRKLILVVDGRIDCLGVVLKYIDKIYRECKYTHMYVSIFTEDLSFEPRQWIIS
jgi:hypothetical protein